MATVLVIGASGGIGHEIVKYALSDGHTVLLACFPRRLEHELLRMVTGGPGAPSRSHDRSRQGLAFFSAAKRSTRLM